MEASTEYPRIRRGHGYAVGRLEDLGEGPGFRKVRKGLEVTAFGVNAIVMPPGIESGFHAHDIQEELYFVHRGAIEMEFGDGSIERLEPGSFARVDADTIERGEEARNALVRQVSMPVRWEESVLLMIDEGVNTFVEVGPGRVLTGLLRQIERSVAALNIEDEKSLITTLEKIAAAKADAA